MHFAALLQSAALLSVVSARSIPSSHVLHEKRHTPNNALNKRVSPNVVLPVRIGLKQNPRSIEMAEDWLMEVSHPTSKKFGQHWSKEEVIEAFKPTDETFDTVSNWLIKSGIAKARITHTDNKAWLAFDATTAEVERLLHTEYFHDGSERALVAAHEYHVPKEISGHIDYITPGVKGTRMDLQKRGGVHSKHTPPRRHGHRGKKSYKLPPHFNATDLTTCADQVTPACVQALYNFTAPDPHAQVSSNNSLGIFEWGDTYAKEDLDGFFSRIFPAIPSGTAPTLQSVDGGVAPVPQSEAGGESSLDFELAYPIVYPQEIILYQTDDPHWNSNNSIGGLFNTWLDAIDGSYCTYSAFNETGDEPGIDATYPDNAPGGYKGPLMCGVYEPANVITVSYGIYESDLPYAYQQRQCNEYLKLGMQGVSVFFASGDTGVGGAPGDGSDLGCLRDDDVFNPSEPNGCPWITDVGATKIAEGSSVHDPEVAAWEPSLDYSSSGGFSNIFPAPKYQLDAIASYYKNHNPSYPYFTDGNYNNSQGVYNRNGRGIPDVSANGQVILVYVNGAFNLEYGTSASSPIFAGLINRIVEERIKVGKGPLGFINPTLYANPDALYDITSGNNPGCNTTGFDAVEGWDPVTGLGTPNYPKLLEVFLALP